MTKYISFDQSTTATAYCIWIDGKYFQHGVINLKKIKEADLRFDQMARSIIQLLEQEKPQVITIEDTALQTNAKTLKDLAQLQGVIMGYCLANNISFTVYSPTKWRAILHFKTGKGVKRPELKQQAIDYVLEKYNITASEDECEAIAIGSAVLLEYQ